MKKKSKKEGREFKVLIGLIDLYLKTGKPIGSQTLREQGFEELSSATIRNYFSGLEEQGFLKQLHSSGGRVPTQEAFRLYAQEILSDSTLEPEDEERLQSIKKEETRNLATFLHRSLDLLSEVTGFATFLSTVRFDHDYIQDIKLVTIDSDRLLCIIVTDFGQILTELLNSPMRLSLFSLKRIEAYFQWRLSGQIEEKKPEQLSDEEELLAKKFYNEIMVRFLVRYSNFSDEDILRTGFSKLLAYPEFSDPVALASGLTLFENSAQMRTLLNDCTRSGDLRVWIGSDLAPYSVGNASCAVIAIPYKIHQMPVGAIGLLGPCRLPYRTLFGTLKYFSDSITEALTKSLYHYKLSFRHARTGRPFLMQDERNIIDLQPQKLIASKE